MTKRLRIVFLMVLVYFLVIIPVQSQEDCTETQEIASGDNTGLVITGDILGGIPQNFSSNDSGQNIKIEEISSGSITGPETNQNLAENNFKTGSTGGMIQINQLPQIIISEVYYDGTEEWIEITNLGSDFSGEVELQIPQSIFFPVSLQPNQSIILTKSSQSYTRISPLVRQQTLPLSFSFTDTKAIFIALQRSGQLLDTFQVETGLVVKYNDKKTSLIKQNIDQVWSITGSIFSVNVTIPYFASPGFFDFSSNFSSGNQNQGTGTSGNSGTGNTQITSGSDLGGGGMTGHVDTPISSSPQPGMLSITEIYQSTGFFSDFIEIQALQDFSGRVFFSGSLLKDSFDLDLFLKNQERVIIVYSDNGWLSNQKIIKEVALDLNTSGFFQVLGQSGLVFDTIQVLSTSGNKSNYHGDLSNGDIDIFSKIDDFSPGFDEQFLVYFYALKAYTDGQLGENVGFSGQTSSGGLSTEIPQNWQDMSGTTSSGITISRKNLQITALSHLNPESLTLKSNLSLSLDLTKKDRYLLSKETTTSERKTTKKYLTGILFSGESFTISKTRGFLDAGSCIGLFYQTGQIDEWCYGSALPQQTFQKQEPENEIENESDFIPDIKILGLLPNPVGKDDHEELHLLRTRSNSTFITQNTTQVNDKSLYLKINSTKKYLTGTFISNEKKVLIGSWGLVNKPACVELWYKENLLDNYCYPQPKEGQYLEKGKEYIQNKTGSVIQNIPIIRIQGLLPNPKGKDNQEIISLLRTPIASGSVAIQSGLNLNQNVISALPVGAEIQTGSNPAFNTQNSTQYILPPKSLYILNNKTKTYFSGALQANTETIFTGSLGLLNKAHCVELRYSGTQLDKFCYPNPKEDQYFGSGNKILQTLQKSDFLILQDVGFIVTGSQICVRYFDQMLTCRQLPAAKTSIKLKNENRLYKTYVGLLQNYLIKNWSTLYFNTPITDYFTVLKNAKAQIKEFSPTISISGHQFNVYDLSGQIQLTTASQGLSGMQIQENISWRNRFLLRLGL